MLHQEVFVDVRDIDALARKLAASVPPNERRALADDLRTELDLATPSQLKGTLNRLQGDWLFSSEAATALLRALARQLSSGR